jgi:hypothetical protein
MKRWAGGDDGSESIESNESKATDGGVEWIMHEYLDFTFPVLRRIQRRI